MKKNKVLKEKMCNLMAEMSNLIEKYEEETGDVVACYTNIDGYDFEYDGEKFHNLTKEDKYLDVKIYSGKSFK